MKNTYSEDEDVKELDSDGRPIPPNTPIKPSTSN